MKIVATNLKKYVKRSKLTIAEIVNQMNQVQNILTPNRRPVTVNSIYTYYYGHTPTLDRIYMLSAILKTKPQKLFGLVYDEALKLECDRLVADLNPTAETENNTATLSTN